MNGDAFETVYRYLFNISRVIAIVKVDNEIFERVSNVLVRLYDV